MSTAKTKEQILESMKKFAAVKMDSHWTLNEEEYIVRHHNELEKDFIWLVQDIQPFPEYSIQEALDVEYYIGKAFNYKEKEGSNNTNVLIFSEEKVLMQSDNVEDLIEEYFLELL